MRYGQTLVITFLSIRKRRIRRMCTTISKCPFQTGKMKNGLSFEMHIQAVDTIGADPGEKVPFDAEKMYTKIPKCPSQPGEKKAGQSENTLDDPTQTGLSQTGQTNTEGEEVVLFQITQCQYSSGREGGPDYLNIISAR
ncbi:hypothetical protein CHS0354_026660 [Potamilus streckersoni]|uniref:Uncharacterized protein n=1 Tax=Potamilus streckersoni TaxID=2493646 RepID=A0AAE0VQY3_9BIVA|nr:hypothetical protein CHS0354_026660 [Potamilus streckersoni]